MDKQRRLEAARAIMLDFAERTGLNDGSYAARRYLWTDAHAVCNFLCLYRASGDVRFEELAEHLIAQVHHVLGKHRQDDPRHGWISGLEDAEGAKRPTAGGLRIGKAQNERPRGEAYDERLEWSRDGQYFHYLTKWMHALYVASRATGQARYCSWALDLARVAHAAFTRPYAANGGKRIVWKMSIDLSYPLVSSAGLHDPLDAYITYNELRLCSGANSAGGRRQDLSVEIDEAARMIVGSHWATEDPLGIGGLLFDASRLVQLVASSRLDLGGLIPALIRDIKISLRSIQAREFLGPPAHRLPFRELGLSIGLHAVAIMQRQAADCRAVLGDRLAQELADLRKYVPLGEAIEAYWLDSANQRSHGWLDHQDINAVMLATSLLPKEFLTL